jgi:archaemetzincin
LDIGQVPRGDLEASSNGRTADFGSAYEGSNPSASANAPERGPGSAKELVPLARPPYVMLVAIGGANAGVLHEAAVGVHNVFALHCRAGPHVDTPKYAFNKERGQYHTSAILRKLASLRPRDVEVPVVGIADVDLFVPDAPYVFGDTDRDAQAALYSVLRLQHSDAERVKRRIRVEAVHAVGHLLGLSHCPDARCAMFLSRDSADADRKGPGLCTTCRSALGLS